ncbi:Serine/threonine-protein phosphatase 7 long form [Sesamum angolense]|uniref:Serine/threonine-protein phosphatase 7 long form n=1 Tax=Sesamum angolense TaxID=2727404 RepID=A0AAE1T7Y3_9LAMI|nr:Serine/threonine-protein phosphatase 7 long form [Sesamum angolense]
MDRRAVYGPRDGTVLSQQSQHRSDEILDGDIDEVLQAKRADGKFWRNFREQDLPIRVQQILHQIGFYGVYRCGRIQYDCHLITALVERWRSETHSFHFRVGEATITLQDVQYIGFAPEDGALKGSRLQVKAIIEHISHVHITPDTPHLTVVQYARAVALLLLGGTMCPDSSGNLVSLLYLAKLEDIVAARNYSWGSAVLAFLYRELCNASEKGKAVIGGALQLVQIWAWSRIIPLCPGLGAPRVHMGPHQIDNNRVLPGAPYGAMWNCEHTFTRTVRTTVRVIRDILDEMQYDQPYDMESNVIMAYAGDFNPQLWRSICPLIFYAIVEMHHPERVLRQFGMMQNIPDQPDTRDMSLHKITRSNRTGTDWVLQHILYITRWQRRYDTVIQRQPISNRRDTDRGYWEWYNNITRHFVSSSTDRRVESEYQPRDAPMLQIVTQQVNTLQTLFQSKPVDVEGYRQLVAQLEHEVQIIAEAIKHQPQQTATPSDSAPTTSHRQRRSSSQMSIGSIERGDIGVDIAGPSTAYTPQDYYVPQLPQDYYVPQPSQDDWFQSTSYMPSHAEAYSSHVDLDLGLGINQPYAPEYNISPVPFPSFSAYRDNVESSSATSSSGLHINSVRDDNDGQNEPIQNMGEEIRRLDVNDTDDHIVEKIHNFPDILKDKKQLQSFLGVVNFAGIFIKDLAKYRKDFRPLLKETESTKWKWEEIHTQMVRELK